MSSLNLFRRLFARKPRTVRNSKRKPAARAFLGLEALETRTLMAAQLMATLNLADGVLRIEGTEEADLIRIVHEDGAVRVDGMNITVSDGDVSWEVPSVARADVSYNLVYGLGGDDIISVDDTTVVVDAPLGGYLYGDAGDDIVYGSWAAENLYGGAGTDTLYGSGGADYLFAGDGIDDVYTSPDQITSDAEDMVYSPLADRYRALPNAALVLGAATSPELIAADGVGSYRTYQFATIQWTAALGADVVSPSGVTATLDGAVLRIVGTEFADTIRVVQHADHTTTVDGVVITVLGGAGATQVDSVPTYQVGRIEVRALGGNDTVTLDNSQEPFISPSRGEVDGGEGNDTLYGGIGNDTLYGGIGNDTLYGRAGADYLDGQENVDRLEGGSENDILIGWTGNDTLFGESGNDTLYGGAGLDYLDGQENEDRLEGGSENDVLIGWTGNDTLFGEGGHDILYGGAGSDQLDGQEGNDRLEGGSENDTLIGWTGNDSLFGEGGHDKLYGGGGYDWLDGGEGNDRIEAGADNDTLIGWNGFDTLFGESGNDSLDGGLHDDMLYGGYGDDSLVGDLGNDVLYGEYGNDMLFGGANDGVDTLYGGPDADRFLMPANKDAAEGSRNYTREDSALDFTVRVDARPTFLDGYVTTVVFSPTETRTFTGLNWTDADVLRSDAVLGVLHREGRSTRLLETGSFGDLVIVRHGTSFRGFNDGWIHMTDATDQFGDNATTNVNLRGYLLHEIGHSWQGSAFASGGTGYWNQFVGISGWTQTNPNSAAFTLSTNEGRGNWWYRTAAGYASEYAKMNVNEDFAESFAAFFTQRAGWTFYGEYGAAACPAKMTVFANWVAANLRA